MERDASRGLHGSAGSPATLASAGWLQPDSGCAFWLTRKFYKNSHR